MAMRKKWFTLVEILFVLVIVWILFQSFQSLWSRNDREINAAACVNNVYWTLRNFVDESFTGKWVYSWNDIFFPDIYTMERWNNVITFNYASGTWIEKNIFFTWDGVDETYHCYSRDYYVWQTGSINKITMNKWLVKKWNTRPFIINDDLSLFTGYINYYISDPDDLSRKILWRVLIDVRTQKVLLGKCMAMTWVDSNWIKECQDWKRTN
jgi:type II secretory pathway pseudopilin PulG